MRYVMIGNSYAAFGAIEAIRRVDKDSPITVISDEPYPCYARPLITFWLGGSVTTDHMFYRPADYYESHNISTRFGAKAASIDFAVKQVVLADGERVPYDKLLIATGGKPFVPPIGGLTPEVKNVHTFTRWDDAKALERLSKKSGKAIVIGGGLIGLKASEGLNDIKIDTTIVELGPRVLALALDEYSGRIASKRLNDNGIKTITGITAKEILVNADNEVTGVVLTDGRQLDCGILVLAIGVRPNIELVKDSAIKVERGIVTDARMQTSVPDVYAAGDVAQNVNLLSGKNEVIAIVPVAYEQGRVAGRNMMGRPTEYKGEIPMNSVEIYGLPIMSMGYTSKVNDQQREECFHDGDVYRKLVFEDNRLVGALLMGNVDYGGVLTHLIRSRRSISPLMMEWLLAGDTLALSAFIIAESSRVAAAR
ncbi:MAG: FAD-dependent oxidoreductase [Desulfobacterales bacterium]|nr:FAD-dependent oxidoreductase [Desulfobacterales bacterium]